MINGHLDIKVEQFTDESLDANLKKLKNQKIKSKKAAGLDEIPPEVQKTKKFDDVLL